MHGENGFEVPGEGWGCRETSEKFPGNFLKITGWSGKGGIMKRQIKFLTINLQVGKLSYDHGVKVCNLLPQIPSSRLFS